MIERLAAPPDNQVQQVELLSKSMLYDKQLSVNRNEPRAFCPCPRRALLVRCRSSIGPPALQSCASMCENRRCLGAAVQKDRSVALMR